MIGIINCDHRGREATPILHSAVKLHIKQNVHNYSSITIYVHSQFNTLCALLGNIFEGCKREVGAEKITSNFDTFLGRKN